MGFGVEGLGRLHRILIGLPPCLSRTAPIMNIVVLFGGRQGIKE